MLFGYLLDADNSGGIDGFSDLFRKQSVLECIFFSLLASSSMLITQFIGTFHNINGKQKQRLLKYLTFCGYQDGVSMSVH